MILSCVVTEPKADAMEATDGDIVSTFSVARNMLRMQYKKSDTYMYVY